MLAATLEFVRHIRSFALFYVEVNCLKAWAVAWHLRRDAVFGKSVPAISQIRTTVLWYGFAT
jgi:hypothetical protein